MSYLDRVELLNCIQCNVQLNPKQSYRKNKYCSNKCMGARYTLPDRVERMRAHGLKYRTNNKEYLAKRRNELLNKRKNMVYDLLGHQCSRCGFADKRALQIDHIQGFGKKSRKRFTNSMHYYICIHRSVLNNENLYQILCANCNWIKRYENKECSWDYTLGRHDKHMTAVPV